MGDYGLIIQERPSYWTFWCIIYYDYFFEPTYGKVTGYVKTNYTFIATIYKVGYRSVVFTK